MIDGIVQRLRRGHSGTCVYRQHEAQKPSHHATLAIPGPLPQLLDRLGVPAQRAPAFLQFGIADVRR